MASVNTAYLSSGPVNVGLLKEAAKRELLDCLNSTGPGRKALVMDPLLVGPIGLVTESKPLKENGVDKIFSLIPGRMDVPAEISNVIFLCRPVATTMRHIAAAVRMNNQMGVTKDYHIFFVPRRTLLCEKVLEEEGVLGDVNIGEFQLELMALDCDLMSLEMPNSFKECYLHGDRTSLFYVARSLMKLQSVFGYIPDIIGKGDNAKLVAQMMQRMRRELGTDELPIRPEIDQIILLDRSVDFVTPLCTQLTYEGLVDEFFGIEHCYLNVPNDVIPPKEGSKKVILHLTSSDTLYSEIRDLNFSSVGPLLATKAKQISKQYDSRHEAKTASQIREFVNILPTLQSEHMSLRAHTSIVERLMQYTQSSEFIRTLHIEQDLTGNGDTDKPNEYVETLIAKRDPLEVVMRLICLQSLANGGLKPKVLEFYKREILQTYGFDTVFLLNHLEKIGLLTIKQERSSFNILKKSLKLIVDDVDENNPQDIAYTYSGYAPLSVRLVQHMYKNGLRGLEEVLKLIPGDSFEVTQQLPSGVQSKPKSRGPSGSGASKVTLVFFLGGCTFGEIAAIRFLGQQEAGNHEFLIGTTKIIKANSLVASLDERGPDL